MTVYYVINKNGHFFSVYIADMQPNKLTECSLYSSLPAMYDAVCKTQHLGLDEVQNAEIELSEKEGSIWERLGANNMPVTLMPSQTIEEYISAFEM